MSKRAIRILGPIVIIAIGILLTEIALRIVPSPIRSAPIHEFDDPDSLLGVEMVPGTRATVQESCYTARITINSSGWRDRERLIEKKSGVKRIAVLGDSFVMASQVNDDETLTRQLEKILEDNNVEVLNFGISSIGTAQQEILYEHVVAAYNPDIILVGFYVNDVQNSSPALENRFGSRLTFRNGESELVSKRKATPFFGLRKWLRIHSTTFRLVKFAQQKISGVFSWNNQALGPQTQLPNHLVIFTDPLPSEWEQGWTDVRESFRRLKGHMKPDQQLIVFAFPDILQIAHDPATFVRGEYGVDPPATFNPRTSYDRLHRLLQEEQITAFETLPSLLAVRDREGLEYPYYMHTCDGHYSAYGLRTIAEILTSHLTQLLQQ